VTSKRLPSLAKFAAMTDPFEELELLCKRLHQSTSESKLLEWKLPCPIGPNVTTRTKYRVAKALISFANTNGGFVLCGVDPEGNWVGVDEADLVHVDPAKITELVNGVVFPEIPNLNYTEIGHDKIKIVVIHTPPSELMPHVTTKQVAEKKSDGKKHILIAHKTVYCRFGAKSDLATPTCFHRIVAKRTEFLRTDLLRRIKEVPVPVPVPSKGEGILGPRTALRVTRLTDDPTAPAVRLTHKRSEASGIYLHEELADGLFDEINNVVEANRLLAKGQQKFFLGMPLYYRVYAERQHVVGDSDLFEILAHAAIHEFYAPGLFWLLHLSNRKCADLIFSLYKDPKSPRVHYLLRVAILLGTDFSEWLLSKWDKQWHKHPQPPDYYRTFKKMINRKNTKQAVLIALRSKPMTTFALPEANTTLTYGALTEAPQQAAKLLSEACLREFEQDHQFRSPARQLDFLAYGAEFAKRSKSIAPLVLELADGDL